MANRYNEIYIVPLSDGRLQFFAIDGKYQLWSCWKETTDPNSGWTAISEFAMPPAPKNSVIGVIQIHGERLPDGRVQIWTIDIEQNLWSCWKVTTDSQSAWTDWTLF